MQKFHHADWLRACQITPNSAESWNWVQKLEIKSIDRKVVKEKLADGQSNLLFSNQAHALDGAINGAIFPWSRDARAFLLLNLALRARAILLVFEKITRAYLFQIALEIMWLPI